MIRKIEYSFFEQSMDFWKIERYNDLGDKISGKIEKLVK